MPAPTSPWPAGRPRPAWLDAGLPAVTHRLLDRLGAELAPRLVGRGYRMLCGYAAGRHVPPPNVEARIALVASATALAEAGRDREGLRAWWRAPQHRLAGLAPADVLEGEWDADAAGPRAVLATAAGKTAPPPGSSDTPKGTPSKRPAMTAAKPPAPPAATPGGARRATRS